MIIYAEYEPSKYQDKKENNRLNVYPDFDDIIRYTDFFGMPMPGQYAHDIDEYDNEDEKIYTFPSPKYVAQEVSNKNSTQKKQETSTNTTLDRSSLQQQPDKTRVYTPPTLKPKAKKESTQQSATTTTSNTQAYQLRQRFIAAAQGWLGAPYLYSGKSRRGVDCSNYVSLVAKEIGINFPGGSIIQWDKLRKEGKTFFNSSYLEPGDLIYFKGTQRDRKSYLPSHVAIYVGNGKMINAAGGNRKGSVRYDNLNSSYWQSHLLGYAKLI